MNPSFLDGSVFGVVSAQADQLPRVLLVDDEPWVLAATELLLLRSGFAVKAVSSAEDAEIKLRAESFDVVVTDFRMGRKNGDAVVLAARGTIPATPVVVVTGQIADLPDWMISEQAALPIVAKPFRMPELLAVIRSAMAEASASLVVSR
jgi:DNA-binding response OmpR family regulator